MFSTITFVVLFLSQICSYSTSNAVFAPDNDFPSGPVQIGGVEMLAYDTEANKNISTCFMECVYTSGCVIATFSEGKCRMYRASDQETNLTSIYVDKAYQLEGNADMTPLGERGCGSVKLFTSFGELSGSGAFSPDDAPRTPPSIARTEGKDSNPHLNDTPDAAERLPGMSGPVPSPVLPPTQSNDTYDKVIGYPF